MFNQLLTSHLYLADTIHDEPIIHENFSDLMNLAMDEMSLNLLELETVPSVRIQQARVRGINEYRRNKHS
jgi:hypothetical protein